MNETHSVARATGIMALGIFCCSAVMELIYTILALAVPAIGGYSYRFPLGNLLMGSVLVLNFFLMSLGMHRAVATGDPDRAKVLVRTSQMGRSLLVIAALVAAFLAPCFDPISVIITVIFPQITTFVYHFVRRRREAAEETEAKTSDD